MKKFYKIEGGGVGVREGGDVALKPGETEITEATYVALLSQIKAAKEVRKNELRAVERAQQLSDAAALVAVGIPEDVAKRLLRIA
jgi:hypothetical protein